MLMSMPSFTLPNPALVRTVRLRRPAAQLFRYSAKTSLAYLAGCKSVRRETGKE